MQIAVFADEHDASSQYRALEPMNELVQRGHDMLLNGPPEVASFDVALISRHQEEQLQNIARFLRRAGLGLIWDLDDAVHAAPHLKRGSLKAQQTAAFIGRMLRAADVVTTTCEPLAAAYREMGAQSVHVIENYLGPNFTDLGDPPRRNGVVLGWAAWSDHQADWEQMELRPVVERLLEAHRDLRVESIGPIDLGLPAERYTRIDTVPFEALGQHLTRFDIGIAPIADTPFNNGRSNIKVKEYAAAGAAWLASDTGPYRGLGEAQGGRLVPDDGWYEQIDLLVKKDRVRRKLAKQGRKWAREQTIGKHFSQWEAVLAEALERASARQGGRR
jgi:hypothetical protein